MRAWKYYIVSIMSAVLVSVLPVSAADESETGQDGFSAKEVVLGHFEDSYWWHIGTFGDREVALYLPVILHSKEGFSIASEGKYKGKAVETLSDGSVVRPFDVSITRLVAALLLNSAIVLALVLGAARWYRRRKITDTPHGLAALMEWAVETVEDDLIKPSVGENWRRFAPFLLTVFGNIAVTFILALASFIVINLFGGRTYWKDIFWPEVPAWLKVPVPLIPLIEFVGIFTKPFALMIRLFANMLAGHAAIICLICVIFITAGMGVVMSTSMTVVSDAGKKVKS